jgi:uncharacterized protein (DUF1501 family)
MASTRLLPPPFPMPTRRGILLGSAAAAALPAFVRPAAAATGGNPNTKFIFIMNYGGWDPTRVLAPEFTNPNVDMERTADEATIGNLAFVDHKDRPKVREFFTTYHDRTTIFKGVLVPSVAHENCLRITMTGSTRQDASDWPAIIGGVQGQEFSLPHVVASGPSFPGKFGAFVTRTGTSGQLPALLDGSIIGWSTEPVRAPEWKVEDAMDRYLARRASAAATAAKGGSKFLAESYASAVARADALKDLSTVVDWSSSSGFADQVSFAVDVLSLGVSRCVTMNFSNYGWDTHAANDTYQGMNFEALYTAIISLMQRLATTAGHASESSSLADETVIVVLSEMGRTPRLNATDGKDHWPYTSMMVVGGGLQSRVVGAYDAYYYGENVDPSTADVSQTSGQPLSADVVGATLLGVAGVDSEDHLPGVASLYSALAK